jgi:HemY protein
MRRSLWILIVLVVAVLGAFFFMTVPGAISVAFGEIAVELPFWLGGLALIVLLLAVTWGTRLVGRLRMRLARRGAAQTIARRGDGDTAIVSALAALAAGDGAGAARDIGRARRLLGETPLVLLLEGHAARARRDEAAAKRAFGRLSEVGPPGAFLGYRGLAALALEHGDRDEAAAAGRAALAMRPDAAWAKALVFDDAARHGDWASALAQIPKARKGTEEGMRRAVLLLGAAAEEQDQKAALRMAEEAVELAPTLAPAHALRVKLLEARGERRRASAALERGIIAAANPMLTALALEPRPGEDAKERARRVEALAGYARGDGEAELMAAMAAKDAGLWAKARRHVALAQAAGVDDRRAFLLLAEIAAGEFAGTEAARTEAAQHLREASAAAPEPAWWCSSCGTRHDTWAPVCGHCGAVATLGWGTARAQPSQPPSLLAAPVPGL